MLAIYRPRKSASTLPIQPGVDEQQCCDSARRRVVCTAVRSSQASRIFLRLHFWLHVQARTTPRRSRETRCNSYARARITRRLTNMSHQSRRTAWIPNSRSIPMERTEDHTILPSQLTLRLRCLDLSQSLGSRYKLDHVTARQRVVFLWI